MALWQGDPSEHPLRKALGRPARTPEFIEMIDNINAVEKTPRNKLIREMRTLQLNDWLMGEVFLRHRCIGGTHESGKIRVPVRTQRTFL